MTEWIAEGARLSGAEVDLFFASAFKKEDVDRYDAIAFGSPAMGTEYIEAFTFKPMFNACLPKLPGKRVALFGFYGWGNREWMKNWEYGCREAGIVLAAPSVTCVEYPDEKAIAACVALGKAFV